jgi:hypothetical protein
VSSCLLLESINDKHTDPCCLYASPSTYKIPSKLIEESIGIVRPTEETFDFPLYTVQCVTYLLTSVCTGYGGTWRKMTCRLCIDCYGTGPEIINAKTTVHC